MFLIHATGTTPPKDEGLSTASTTSPKDEDLSKAIYSTTEYQALGMYGNY